MKLNEILQNSFWYGVVPKLSSILSLLVLPFITPFLTPSDYGVMGLINSYLGLATGICTLGLHMHLTNSFFEFKNRYQPLWRRLFFLMGVSSILLSLVLIVVFVNVLQIESVYTRVLVAVFAIVPLLLYPNLVIASHYYPLVAKPKAQVLRNLGGSILGICVSFVLIRYYHLGYLGWIISAAFSSLLVFALFLKPLWIEQKIYPQIEKNRKRIISLMKVSVPIIPHNLGHVLLSSSDRLIMSLCAVSIFDIGLYSNGYQIGEYASFVISGLFTALSPTIQRAYRDHDQRGLVFYYKVSSMIITLFIFMCGLWMKEFYSIFIRNTQLQPSFMVASFVCFSFLINGFYTFFSAAIMIEKETKKVLFLVFVPAIVNIVLNFIFIPLYGYIAAVYSTVFAYWLIVLLPFTMNYFKQLSRKMFVSRRVVVESLIGGIIVLFIAYFFRESEILLKAVISIGVLLMAFFYYRYFIFKSLPDVIKIVAD